jgi:hypothetical protein
VGDASVLVATVAEEAGTATADGLALDDFALDDFASDGLVVSILGFFWIVFFLLKSIAARFVPLLAALGLDISPGKQFKINATPNINEKFSCDHFMNLECVLVDDVVALYWYMCVYYVSCVRRHSARQKFKRTHSSAKARSQNPTHPGLMVVGNLTGNWHPTHCYFEGAH